MYDSISRHSKLAVKEVSKMHDYNQISAIVRETLQQKLPDIKIISVKVSEQWDPDGDEVLRIVVVFEAADSKVDTRKFASAVRYLRPKFDEICESAFPLLSFITKSDAEQTGFEPA